MPSPGCLALSPVSVTFDEARKWNGLVRAAARECLETCPLQAAGGPVTADALDQILHRFAVLVMRQLESP